MEKSIFEQIVGTYYFYSNHEMFCCLNSYLKRVCHSYMLLFTTHQNKIFHSV